jgi:hypothetical protein
MTRDEGFLSRWSRRKAEANATPEELAPVAAPPTDEAIAPAAADKTSGDATPAAVPDMRHDAPPDEETRQTWIARLEAIDLEALTYNDDFTIFMKKWVPQALRNRALRRLWHTSDMFDGLDRLVDYDDDFSIAPAAVGSIKSSWQVGRGFAPAADAEPDGAAQAAAPDDIAGQDEAAVPEAQACSETADDAVDKAAGGESGEAAATGDDSPSDESQPADTEAATDAETPGSGKASS